MPPGSSYIVRFLTPGTYDYHCEFHLAQGMTGTVVVQGTAELHGKERRLEGELLGLAEAGAGGGIVRLKLPGGDEVDVPLDRIRKANLVFKWK